MTYTGADVLANDDEGAGVQQFRYPSYVQHIMGDIFSLGFGPFRYLTVVDTYSNCIAHDCWLLSFIITWKQTAYAHILVSIVADQSINHEFFRMA